MNPSNISSIADATPILDGVNIHALAKPGVPLRLRGFHGTTQDFDVFDTGKAWDMGHFGRVLYFTSSLDDAQRNYASPDGPDIRCKVERRAETIENDLWNEGGFPEDVDLHPEAERRAEEEIVGDTPMVHEVLLTLHAPFFAHCDHANHQMLLPGTDEAFHRASEQVRLESEYDEDEFEERFDEFEEEILQAEDDILGEEIDRLLTAFNQACADLGSDHIDLLAHIPHHCELTHATFEQVFRSEPFCYLEDLNGELINNSLLSLTLSYLGYDSILLFNANKAFASMSMDPHTTHIHILPGHEGNITTLARTELTPEICAAMAA